MNTIFIYVALATAVTLMIMSMFFAKRRTEWPTFLYWLVTPFTKRTPQLIHHISWIVSIASMGAAIVLLAIEQGRHWLFVILASISMIFVWWFVVIIFCWVIYCIIFFIKNPKLCLGPIAKWVSKWFKLEK